MDTLFLNQENINKLEEYTELISLMKKYIKIIEKYVSVKECRKINSYEGVCYMFTDSVVKYMKSSYDNILLGHFHASNMLNRAIIENFVCLSLIFDNQNIELWKYWILHSYYNSSKSFNKGIQDSLMKNFRELCDDFEIEKIYIEKYINKQYGWTFKINDNFSFSGLCNIFDKKCYQDYKIMCSYTHGTSFFQKANPFMFNSNILTIFSVLFVYSQRFVEMYCFELLEYPCLSLRDEIYSCFNSMIEEGVILS